MNKIIVAGCGTDVGKTIVSAILVNLLNGDYWKPIQCGSNEQIDSDVIKNLIDPAKHMVFPSIYSLKAPLSPHHAARLENISIDINLIIPPEMSRPLVIESVGGICVPLSRRILSLELFESWDCKWVVVSRDYLGSINHTLLTLEVLQKRNIAVAGLIFNGELNPDSEEVICEHSQLPIIGRLFPEADFNLTIIKEYVQQWQSQAHLLRQ